MMTALNVNGSLNITGQYKINGEIINTTGCVCEKFDNKITGGLQFLENSVMQGTISGLKEDGISSLKLKQGNVIVDGDLVVDGAAYKGPISVTTDEQATGEKFLWKDVYIKGWQGDAPTDDTIANFFPCVTCCIVSYGGDSLHTNGARCPFPYSSIKNLYRTNRNLFLWFSTIEGRTDVRIWVKYTHE
jgi:hypothetical protein